MFAGLTQSFCSSPPLPRRKRIPYPSGVSLQVPCDNLIRSQRDSGLAGALSDGAADVQSLFDDEGAAGSKVPVWLALGETRPLAFFTGIQVRGWKSVRKA